MVLPEFGLARDAVDRWFRDKKLRPRVYSEVAGNEAILALVSLGCGVGVLPRLVVERSPLREDEIGECLEPEELLRNAPQAEENQFRVPPVLDNPH